MKIFEKKKSKSSISGVYDNFGLNITLDKTYMTLKSKHSNIKKNSLNNFEEFK